MKYILILALLASSFVSISQRVVTIPERIANEIKQELIEKDSCFQVLELANEQIYLLESSVSLKNEFIDSLQSRVVLLNKKLSNEEAMKNEYKLMYTECNLEYKSQKSNHNSYKRFTKVIGFLGTAVIAGLAAVVIFVK